MSTRLQNAVRTSFAADAVILPVHWVYDETAIAKYVNGPLKSILEPNKLNEHHSTRKRGDFTHYGDQELALLEAVKDSNGVWDSQVWSEKWHQLFNASYLGYRDHATKNTIENGKASDSGDLSGASRFAPVLLLKGNEDSIAQASREQAALTHNQPQVLGAADFFARLAFRLANSSSPDIAKEIQGLIPSIQDGETKRLVQLGFDAASKGQSDEDTVRSFGEKKTFGDKTFYTAKACPFGGALPSVVYFLTKYSDKSTTDVISASTLVGGDNAARGIAIGAIFGAAGKEVPTYYADVNAKANIEALLSK